MAILVVLTIFLPLSLLLSAVSLILFFASGGSEGNHVPVPPLRWLIAFLLPIFIVKHAVAKKTLDKSGALAAMLVGFILTLSNFCFMACLLAFFISASKATKFRADLKRKLESDYERASQRNWIQVVCNGGVAAQMALLFIMEAGCGEFLINFNHNYTISWLCMSVVGAIAACCGDTYASELGSVIGRADPRLITNFKVVPKGTNGGISLVGSVMSFVGGMVVGLAFYVTLLCCMDAYPLQHSPPQWPIILVAGLAGFLGSMVDSLMGATLQYSGYDKARGHVVEHPGPNVRHICGAQVLDNHSVNLITCFIMSLVTPLIALHCWAPYGHVS